MKVEIKKINLKAETQSRVKINQDIVNEYAADLKEGAVFPSVVLFKQGQNYYIGDGWHRVLAHKKASIKSIDAEIKEGSKRDAVFYSVGSNAVHGLRRTNEDKRKAVTMLLSDREWAQWSNREIARKASVGESLVRTIKKNASAFKTQMPNKKAMRDGKEYTINTVNIGQNVKQDKKLKKQPTAKETNVIIDDVKPVSAIMEQGYRKFNILGWDILIRKKNRKDMASRRLSKPEY